MTEQTALPGVDVTPVARVRRGFLAPAVVSSDNHEWQTPKVALDCVRAVGPIGLDPCTVPENPVGARHIICPPDDGTVCAWPRLEAGELVFVNSPFGVHLPRWLLACQEAAAAGFEVIALFPARTDRDCVQAALASCDSVCWWRGRMKFVGAKDAAPFPVGFFYWGPRRWAFGRAFGPRGFVQHQATGWLRRRSLP